MSIQSEIDRIITAVGSAYDAVESKGGTAPAAQTIGGLATAVGTIPTGIAPQLVVTVSAGATVTATNGSKTISGTADSTGVCTLTVPETGTWSVSATLDGQTSDTKTVSITGSYAVALSFVSSTLNNNEWRVIKSVSDAGQGANYWSIGDRKAVTLEDADMSIQREIDRIITAVRSAYDAVESKGGTATAELTIEGLAAAVGTIPTGIAPQLIVTVSAGATVTATNGSKTISGTADSTGVCTLTVPETGTWSVSATLDGQTSDTKTVSITDTYMVALTFFYADITVTVDSGASVSLQKDGTTIQTKTSTGTVVFTVTETGTYTIVATKNGQTTSGSVNVVSSTTSYALTLFFVSSTLNNNEWSVIKSVSDAGQGANYWSIGDSKAVTLNGKMSKLSLSNVTTYAFIIGFNHNASVEGSNRIHFQIGKTALSGGTDVCLVSGYDNDSDFYMNTSNTNAGGWNNSYMRKTILGTSLSSYSGTFIGVLPAALRAVLKSVTKYTDNTGGGSTAASAVTATTDYAFLLSEYEVFGRISRANSNEASKQAQYDYYKAGNSKVKYNNSATSTVIAWWLRSPRARNSSRFVYVLGDGTINNTSAGYSNGVAPGFCV